MRVKLRNMAASSASAERGPAWVVMAKESTIYLILSTISGIVPARHAPAATDRESCFGTRTGCLPQPLRARIRGEARNLSHSKRKKLMKKRLVTLALCLAVAVPVFAQG